MTDTTEPDFEASEPTGVPGIPTDWPQQATTRLVDVVDTVRIKTSGPAIQVSRAIVYGLVGTILGLVALPLLLVGLTRLLDYAIPGDIWRVYVLIGAVFTLVGLILWSRRPRGAART
ncbi:MAG: hypothetical protein ACR2PK_11700 [Acidimicrobiales bacterium]